jgi:hypothetical protein
MVSPGIGGRPKWPRAGTSAGLPPYNRAEIPAGGLAEAVHKPLDQAGEHGSGTGWPGWTVALVGAAVTGQRGPPAGGRSVASHRP